MNNLDAIQMLRNQWEVKIQHVNREDNRVAGVLAKHIPRWELRFYKFLRLIDHVLKLIHDDLEGLIRID